MPKIPRSYSSEFQQEAVKKLLSSSLTLSNLSRELGVPSSTLFGWKANYVKNGGMKTPNKKAKDWAAEEKLEIIIKTATMGEAELGEFLRSNGLYSEDLKRFKEESLSGLKAKKGRPELDPEVHHLREQNKKLEKDIKRKDRALAEYSARVILLKKSHEIWGKDEADE